MELDAEMDTMQRVTVVLQMLQGLDEEMDDFMLSDQWARLMDETVEVSSRIVGAAQRRALRRVREMDPEVLIAAVMIVGAKLVVAGRRAGPSSLLVSSICDTLAGEHDEAPGGPRPAGYFEAIVRRVLELAEVI